MNKLSLLSDLLLCIKDNKIYQNSLRQVLLDIQQKLRWIALARKKLSQKSHSITTKIKRKRIPYHPSYQLLNLLKTKIKRQNFPTYSLFSSQEKLSLESFYTQFPNNWQIISQKLQKSPLDCFHAFQQLKFQNSLPSKLQWTPEEDLCLSAAVVKLGKNNWSEIANHVDGKTSSQCYHRYMKTISPSIKRGKWSLEEDLKLAFGVKIMGMNWVALAEILKNRTDIQCRERYCNVLSPSINTQEWEFCEDIKLMLLMMLWGKSWSKIARVFKGRTDNQCWRRSKFLIKTSGILKSLVIIRLFRPKVNKDIARTLQKLLPLLDYRFL